MGQMAGIGGIMNKNSLISRTTRMIVIQSALLFIIFISYIVISYRTALQDLRISNQNIMRLYTNELDNKLEKGNALLERLIYKNSAYDMLQSASSADRYYAAKELSDYINEQATYDEYVDAVIIAESIYEYAIDYAAAAITYQDKLDLRDHAMEAAAQGHAKAEWKLDTIGAKDYIYKMYVWQGKSVGVFIAMDHFLADDITDDLQKVSIVLTDDQQRIWGLYGDAAVQVAKGDLLDGDLTDQWNVHTTSTLSESSMQVHMFSRISGVLGQIRSNVVVILILLAILAGFSILLIRFLREEMIVPMRHMQQSMEQMQSGDYNLRIQEEYGSSEFRLFKDTFNRLMDEIVGLRIQSYEKQIDLQEMELKCVKLQIRPHFFLNAMTTISSLSQQGKNQEITAYISALSKNIRYMFRSGLHTVPLQEEIQHVENYFEMQELKYPGCVFYFIDIDPAYGSWRIPQMLIHTIIENEYKYAVNINKTLTILIRAERTVRDGLPMLLLEIEDDGAGYPAEVLTSMAGTESMTSAQGERVGLQSIKRILELMYERTDLFTISNIEPHGCKNTFLLPERAVQELQEQRLVRMD